MIALKYVLTEFAGGLFNMDAPVLRTTREFLLRPGKVTRAYLAGKRKAYTPPVRFFLFGIAFYFVVRWLFQWDPVLSMVGSTTGEVAMETPAMRVNLWMSRNVNLLLPIWVMLLATFDRVLFPRAGLRWVERVVHYLFAIGEYLILATLMIPIIKFKPSFHVVNYAIIFGMLIWSAIDLHRMHWWTVLRGLLMVPISFMVYVVLDTVLVAWLLDVPLELLFQRPGP